MKNYPLFIITLIAFATLNQTAIAQSNRAEFKGKYGQNGHISGKLKVGQQIAINGDTELSKYIYGKNGAGVNSIGLETRSWGIYDYRVYVWGGGPYTAGRLYLRFIDETKDHYDLSLYSSRKTKHSTKFNSSRPTIVKVLWSNKPFPSDLCKTCNNVVGRILEKAIEKGGGCDVLVEEITAGCDLIFGGPEDVIGDIICGILDIEFIDICEQVEKDLSNKDIKAASKKICNFIDLCN